jgi:hypothetical protein
MGRTRDVVLVIPYRKEVLMKLKCRFFRILAYLVPLAFVLGFMAPTASVLYGDDVTSPEEFFGFKMGADRKIAHWDKIVEYFQLLEKESKKIKVENMGPSTEGNPFLHVIISSEDNMSNLEELREVNLKLSDPRGIPESEIKKLVARGKGIVHQSMGLHATEIGGVQMAPELAYDLLSRTDEETQRILDEVIFLMFPSFNPDGQIMVTDWYNEQLGTEYEGTRQPSLYHKYVGHDNNRDGDFLNMIESVYAAKILYRDWKPQAYLDHHHMGSYGPRFYVPPYCEPIRPYADPLVWREMSLFGGHIAYRLEQEGKTGILNKGIFSGWGHFGWHWITPFHNIAGMLTESANALLATPLYIHPEQLSGGGPGLAGWDGVHEWPEYEEQTTIPSLWPGGWWRLRDIVEQKKISSWALLDVVARHRETVLWNAYLKGKRQTERGANGTPKAYVIPNVQHDALTAVKMINTLMLSDIEIHRADEAFTVDGITYGAGSYVVPLAQPKYGLIRNLLGRTFYPDNQWTRSRDGAPLRPYDSATHTMFEYMGVRVDPVDEAVKGDITKLTAAVPMEGKVAGGSNLLLDGRLNASFKAVNLLLDEGVAVRRVDEAAAGVRPGDFIVASGAALSDVAKEAGVDFTSLSSVPSAVHDVKRARVGMYHRYQGGNMDEGWTRFILEQFAFPYKSVMSDEVKAGNLNANYDVFILPHDRTDVILGTEKVGRWGGPMDPVPPEYRSGIGDEGVEAIRDFVQKGGVLVCLGDATHFGIETFDLAVRNVVENLPNTDFYCPGSTVRVTFDNTHPLGYGMPSEGLVLFWTSPAFAVQPNINNDEYATVVRYADKDLMASGWLIGEEHIAKQSGMIQAKYGEGSVVLIGFRTQNRAQTHGTFKLFFNTMVQ